MSIICLVSGFSPPMQHIQEAHINCVLPDLHDLAALGSLAGGLLPQVALRHDDLLDVNTTPNCNKNSLGALFKDSLRHASAQVIKCIYSYV